MPMTPEREWFEGQLRLALASLYNPPLLRKSPLIALLGLGESRNGALALQESLLEAIESLRPPASVPVQSDMWRFHQVLRRRYTEQAPQAQVANDLGLSIRQLQRTEGQARDELASALWDAHRLETRVASLYMELHNPVEEQEDESHARQARLQELEYLSRSLPAQVLSLRQVVDAALDTVAPLAAAAQVEITCALPEDVPALLVQAPLLHQAVVNLICFALDHSAGGAVQISSHAPGSKVTIEVTGSRAGVAPRDDCAGSEQIETAAHLAKLCGGELATSCSEDMERAPWAMLTLPACEQISVLAVDDNLDTQQLYSRYLAGSRYRLLGAHTVAAGMSLALEMAPRAIILDVMMPDRDGWTLLGQLREHPDTHAIPVIICSVMPQEQLALVLGAASFLRKPVSREDLLRVLAQMLEQNPTAAR